VNATGTAHLGTRHASIRTPHWITVITFVTVRGTNIRAR